MAFGRNQRFDSRKSSSYCSSATLVVFVALCLVGVWMMTSSTVVPIQLTTSEKSEVSGVSNRLEDLPGDSSEVTKQQNAQMKGDSTVDYNASENLDDKFDIRTKGETEDSVNTPKSQTYNDANGTAEGGEVARTVDNMDNDLVVPKKGQGKAVSDDQSSNGTVSNDQLQPDRDNNFTESQLDDSDNENNAEEAAGNKNKLESKRNSVGTDKSSDDAVQAEQDPEQIKEDDEENRDIEPDKADLENTTDNQLPKEEGVKDVFPDGTQLDLLNETNTLNGASWSTQAAESKNEKDVQASSSPAGKKPYSWKLCNASAAADYIPCLDNEEAIKKLRSTKHYEHRERHCPEESPVCLVPLPKGYRRPIYWPNSRDKIWYSNVPHTQLAEVKGHQNWVKVSGEHLVFPGGGTQFKNGALHYIDFIQESMPDIAWGKHSRVVLDVGCGVASFGGYLFDRDTLTMSFAPKDEHEAQVQFALERGIPAISAVMGTSRLPFPSRVFDLVHCARCRVPWHAEGGMLLLELNRLLRPGGHFVWSATPVYRKTQEDMEIWNAMSALTKSICWEMVAKRRDVLNEVGLAIFRKPLNNSCYEERKLPLCHESDNPNAAWNIGLQRCIHKLPGDPLVRGSQWPEEWPLRLETMPYWLNHSLGGVYGKPASNDFLEDYKHWKKVVGGSYSKGMGIHWPAIRNVMDMRSVYGGFGAVLSESKKVWVMNVVSIDSPDTLPVIYERGLFGIYHDWCESFSSYPRTYDLIHADHLFSTINDRCKMEAVFVEVDRLLRPEGKLIVRDSKETANKLQDLAESLHWEVCMAFAEQDQAILCLHKTAWRPDEAADS